ncbi:MAG: carboxypeptidase regulatory-like domain-containing protein [Planctomycetes bacterium]|nr:carboxypeptidase regulatory-like domain-containing protein [Planctomycetota bacterium]MCB9884338.1 carboxypeptidase regulatory-like domain-containing protein [Planctomycetota bacterium]
MQRPVVLVLLVVFAALATFWLWPRGDTPPPGPVGPQVEQAQEGPGAATAEVGNAGSAGTSRGAQREAVASLPASVLDDPEIQAGLSGFRGRVVDFRRTAVADCGVRIFRLAQDSILPENVDLFADEPTITPQYIAGDTRTAADGSFAITGVWPRGFYVMFAGIDTDAPMHQLLTQTPSPGEIVDLGDVVLPNAGVITGTVVDEEGEGVAGALVRAVDLPGTIASFFPAERFDPEGAVLIREPNSPVRVIEMPKWAKRAFEDLPIPSTTTDSDGSFRLVGVVPGSNFFAVTARTFLAEVKPSVIVRAGQEKNLGRVRIKHGEELAGRVLDTKGEPVADAEVFAGSTIAMVPFDLAQRVGTTDAEGRFHAEGFAPGKVTVAARRGRGHAWVLAEPQPVLGEVVVTLPATLGAVASVRLADGKPATEARFKLLQGRAGDGAAEMSVLGVVPPIDLRDRLHKVGGEGDDAGQPGQWRIDNLLPGRYTLVVDAPGHAVAFSAFTIEANDAAVTIELQPKKEFVVVVLDPTGEPIRNAAIHAVGRGQGKMFDMPLNCGRTGEDGRLIVDKIQAETARVTADHPKWGMVHGEVKWGEELLLRMQAPGALHGVITENGKPPKAGELTVAIEPRRNGPRGALDDMPQLQALALDGTFTVRAMQPGEYRVGLVKALEALRSPGGVFAMAQDMFMANRLPRETAQVVSGQTAEVHLEAGEQPIEGPTANLSGTVTVDGKIGAGYAVMASHQGRRFSARADARGQFDFGLLPAGELEVGLLPPAGEAMIPGGGGQLWATKLELASAEAKVLNIDVNTGSISGFVSDPVGAAVAGAQVVAEGRTAKSGNNLYQFTMTDAQGTFRLSPLAEGTWKVSVRVRGDNAGRAELEGVVVNAGSAVDGLRLQLTPAIRVQGRIDVSVFDQDKPQWTWLAFHKLPENGSPNQYGDQVDGAGVDRDTGRFSTSDLKAGTYRVRLHAGFEKGGGKSWYCGEVVVLPTGATDLVLRPGPDLNR